MGLLEEITGKKVNYKDIKKPKKSTSQTAKDQLAQVTEYRKMLERELNNVKNNYTGQESIGGTVGSTLTAVGKGILGGGEQVADFLTYRVADLAGLVGANKAKKALIDNAKFNSTEAVVGKAANAYDDMAYKGFRQGETFNQVGEGVGNALSFIAAGALTPAKIASVPIGKLPLLNKIPLVKNIAMPTVSVIAGAGGAQTEALNEGATYGQSLGAAVGGGAIEGLAESLFGTPVGGKIGNALAKAYGGKGALDDVFVGFIGKNMNTVGKNLIKLAAGTLGEGLEENISGVLTPYLKRLTYDQKAALYTSEEAKRDFLVGALSSLITQSPAAMLELNKESVASGKPEDEIIKEIVDEIPLPTTDPNIKEAVTKVTTNNQVLNDGELQAQLVQITTAISKLENKMAEIAPLGTVNIEGIYQELSALRQQRDELLANATEEQQVKVVDALTADVQNLSALGIGNPQVNDIINDKQQQIEKLTTNVDKNKKIKTVRNKQTVKAESQKNVSEAAAFIEQMNATLPQGQNPITMVLNMTPEQQQVADVASIFGKQVIFANNLPYSVAVSKANPNLLFIDTKPSSGLITNNQGAMLYTMGHELFHSLKMQYPEIYNEFIHYVKGSIEIQQIVDFMQRYDINTANQRLEGLKINGEFNLQELLDNPTKHEVQTKALNDIIEEIVANEFGGMITDKVYMKKLATDNKSLFDRIAKALKELFKSLKGSIYNSSLTQLQVEKIRNDFETIVSEIQQKETKKSTTALAQENAIKESVVEVEQPVVEKKKTETKKSSEYQIPEIIYRSTNTGITSPKMHSIPGAKFYSTKQEISARYSKTGETKTANVANTIQNPLIIEGNEQMYNQISFENKKMRTDDIVAIAKERGFDAVIFKNIIDSGPFNHGRIQNPVSDIIVTIEQESKNTIANKEVKEEAPKKTTEEMLRERFLGPTIKKDTIPTVETVPVKTSTMTVEQRAANIKSLLDTYNRTDDPKRKEALKGTIIKAYDNYLNDGGVEVIDGVAQWVPDTDVKQLPKDEQKIVKITDAMRNSVLYEGQAKFLPKEEATGNMKISKTFKNALEDPMTNQNIIAAAEKDPNYAQYKSRVNNDDWKMAEERIRNKGLDAGTELFAKETEWTPIDLFTCYMLERYYGMTGNPSSELAMYDLRKRKGTTFAQNLQAFNVLRGLTPAAVVYGVKRDLAKAMEAAAKSQDATMRQWVSEMSGRATLTRAEEEWLYQMGAKLQKLDPKSLEYKRRENLIKLFVANKIPKAFWKKMKNFRRVAMLFNPKTIARNFLGNVSMAFVNIPMDTISGVADKMLSTISNIRTVGTPDVKAGIKGLKEGTEESNEDRRLGTNSSQLYDWQEPEGDTWDNNTVYGRALNWAEKTTNYLLDVTDRPLEKMYYENSLAVQMRLNNVTEPTETMKQIAQYDARRRTWKDEGKLFKHAQNFRVLLNHVGFKDGRFQLNIDGGGADFGLGDVILPFIITPANLITAAFEYSPAGAVTLLNNHKKFKEAIASNNELEIAMAQKVLSENYGKMITGTLLIAIASVLAKAGLTTGGEDDDEDIRQTMRNQGYQPFAFKVGDFTFTYDWLQPVASPFAIMAELERKNNIYKGTDRENSFLDFSRSVAEGFLIGGERMYEQSFLKGVQQLFSGDNPTEGLFTTLTNLPASFVPTLAKSMADAIDNTSKKTYDRQNPLYQIYGQAAARIPFLKNTLDSNVTTLGEDKKMYGDTEGFARIFNTFFNPSLVSKDVAGEVGKEIMDVYSHTGEKSIFPQVAVRYMDYDINGDGVVERVNLSNKQQTELQKVMGKIAAEGINGLLRFDGYNNASYEEKSKALISLIEYSKGKALEQSKIVPNYKIKGGNALQINKYITNGLNVTNAVMYDSIINAIQPEKDENGETIPGSMNGMKAYEIMNMPTSDEYKNIMLRLIHNKDAKYWETVDTLSKFSSPQQFKDYYSLQRRDSMYIENFSRDDYDIATTHFNVNGSAFIKYVGELGNIRNDVDKNGETITNSKKTKVINYIQSLPLNQIQKIMLFKSAGYSVKQYTNALYSYVKSLNITAAEKQKIWTYLTE